MKKNIVLLILVSLALFVSADAQQSAAKRTVKTESWVEFTAKDRSFKILFPKQTEKDKAATRPMWEIVKENDKDQLIIAGNMGYGVLFNDYPAAAIDEMERNMRYALHSSIGRKTKDIFAQKHPGVEFVTEIKEGGVAYDTFFRLFLVQQRLFSVSVLVPAFKTLSAAQRKIYQANIDKFFNSFTVLDIPAAKYEAIPLLPKDFKVSLNGQKFQSEVLNLNIQFPAGWTNETHDPNRKPNPDVEKESIMLRWHWRNNDRFAATKSPTENVGFVIGINRKEFASVTLQEYVEMMAGFLGSDLFAKTKTPLPVTPVVINGRKFLMFEQSEDGKQKRYYYADLDKWILEIRMGYQQESDKKIMEDSLNTLKF